MHFALAAANTLGFILAIILVGAGLRSPDLSMLVLLAGFGLILMSLCGAIAIYVLARDIDWRWIGRVYGGLATACAMAWAILRLLEQLKVI